MNIPEVSLPRIVVIGCGFAGLKFCNKVDTSQYQVVLLDKNNYHTFQPLLYQVATSGLEPDSIIYPIRKIFQGKKNFFFRKTTVEHIDTEKKTIQTSISELTYDILVIATGGNTNFFGLENIERFSMPMKTLVESLDLRSKIIQNFEEALNTSDLKKRAGLMNFVVVGAGPTGIELAGALAELRSHILPNDYPDLDIRRMEIHVVEAGEKALAAMSPESSKKTEAYLKKMGVEFWPNTFVEDYDGLTVKTNKKSFESKTVIWAAGITAEFPEGMNLETGMSNRIKVDGVNQVRNLENVFVIGDVSLITSEDYPNGHPMLASVAEQQGKHLAKNLGLKAKGKEMRPFVYNDKGTMATIGRNKAVVDIGNTRFSGVLGWLTWMFVHLMLLVDFRSKLVVFVNWVWNYINYDRGTRLIVREFKEPEK